MSFCLLKGKGMQSSTISLKILCLFVEANGREVVLRCRKTATRVLAVMPLFGLQVRV